MRYVAKLVSAVGLALFAQACVVHDTPVPVGYGFGYTPANSAMGQPNPYEVSSLPPEPLYEQMTPSPGEGFVWIDGYWHWNGSEWVWVSGRWEQQQDGYVYVEPYYDTSGAEYLYTPGYWALPSAAPRGWNVLGHHDGRPTIIAPPVGRPPGPGGTASPPQHPITYRPPVVGPRPVQPQPAQPYYPGGPPQHYVPPTMSQPPSAVGPGPVIENRPTYDRPPTAAPSAPPTAPIYSRPATPVRAAPASPPPPTGAHPVGAHPAQAAPVHHHQ